MSRSAPTLQNPAHRFFEYKPQAGILQYYDKDKAERVEVPLPFEFLVLAQTAKIGGYSKPDKAGYYSNEVLNSRKEPFTVFLKGAQVYHGLYKTEQGIVQIPKAAKYIKTLYVAYKEDGNWVIGNLSLPVGSPLTAWIEFTKKHRNVEDSGKVIMTRGTEEEAPTGKYFPPAFEFVNSNEEEENAAFTLDKVIQAHLTRYFAAARVEQNQDSDESDDDPTTDSFNTDDGKASAEQVAEFERLKAQKLSQPSKTGVATDQMNPNDYPEDDQSAYNRQAVAEVFGDDDEPLPDVPPEYM